MDQLRKKFHVPTLFLFLLGLAAATLLSYQGLEEMVQRWLKQEEYSHGFMIPMVSFYILWEQRCRIIQNYSKGSPLGIPVVVLALLVVFIGELAALYILVQYGFILLLLGFALTLLGREVKYTLVPIGLLVFSIPLPYFLEAVLTSKLQLLSSELGVALIRLMNIPVFLSGNIIDLGEFKLQVVEACSGLNYLFPLSCLGFLAAYFYQAPFWKRSLIFLSTIPITIFTNSFRIAVTGILVDRWGPVMAEGFLHDFEGWIIFMACAALLALEIHFLERITTGRNLSQVFGLDSDNNKNALIGQDGHSKVSTRLSIPMVFITAITVVVALTAESFDRRAEQNPQNVNLSAFPAEIEEWKGRSGTLDTRVIQVLQLTDYLTINYTRADDPMINLYIAYYASQRKGVSPHSPRVCIPGGGWEIASIKRTVINQIPVNRVLIRKGLESQLVYYWFHERGEPIANEYLKKIKLLRDALVLNRTDGALIRVASTVDTSEAEADERLTQFVRHAYPEISNILPGKGDSPK